jgi:hypothetical protein
MRPSAPSPAAGAFVKPTLTATMQCERGNSKIVISYGGLSASDAELLPPGGLRVRPIPGSTNDLVAEMADAGEYHCDPGGVRRGDDFFVAHRPAWLDNCGDPRLDRRFEAVGKGKEGV